MITPQEYDSIAQRAHFLFGALVPCFAAMMFPNRWWVALASGIGIILFATYKEFYWDEHFEDVAHRGSNLRDWTFYLLGVAFVWVFYFLKHPPPLVFG